MFWQLFSVLSTVTLVLNEYFPFDDFLRSTSLVVGVVLSLVVVSSSVAVLPSGFD